MICLSLPLYSVPPGLPLNMTQVDCAAVKVEIAISIAVLSGVIMVCE